MKTGVIHKIIITEDAVFDYEEALDLGRLDKRAVKAEAEEYISRMFVCGRLLYANYFRCKYLDEDSDQMLMLFLYRADKFSIMQNWAIKGICLATDWDEYAEDDGYIRRWLKGCVTDLDKTDWVLEQQMMAEADALIYEFYCQGSIQGIPKEAKNAIEYGNYKEYAETVSLLQNAGGKRPWRNIPKRKDDLSRKLNKRT